MPDYVRDLRQPAGDPGTFFVDPELAPPRLTGRQALEAAAAAPSLAAHLSGVRRMNPLYEELRRGLAAWRAGGGSDPAQERLIRASLERARAIPADPGRRFILVDAAGARLWLYEDGRVVDTMRAIVGKPAQQTPAMAGLIRFAVLNPYWNLPQDLVPGRIARHVLSQGPDYLRRERMEILSDYTAGARRLDPSEVDWPAVAAGTERLRVRQLPGAGNMMGKVKFMMPNRLGIYLHDTPDKSSFGRADRRLSSGCVRVEDAERLSRWLFGGRAVQAAGAAAEQRVDLPAPVPVYITYLTAAPAEGGGIAFQADVYGRDPEWLARLDAKAAPAA
ncbi:MAG TPA: L,D-transpeptidase family protein [Allosphingosinicella sp.]|jgi:murein L,D-transpeptidase YcbB/YkuD